LSDLKSEEWRALFSILEDQQKEFLSRENQFRSADYKWPRDPLHTWSRIWEYPYVYHHLRRIKAQFSFGSPKMLDYGSGVTFFPFSAAKLGYRVTCADIDPICAIDISRAANVLPHGPGTVDFELISENSVQLPSSEMDIVICISVLEHIPTFASTISELARLLKPGGVLILTIDLDLRGDSEIGVQKHADLLSKLRRYFDLIYPEDLTHPADVLNSANSPFPQKPMRPHNWKEGKQLFERLLLRKPAFSAPFFLAVQGFVMRKVA
jgi:2-polyprenyl-3-methyl-5-hydroxy-6-metoxy-1,4-benzoquinol methylase